MKIKSIINSLLKTYGYKCVKIKNLTKKNEPRFSLNTGERQVALHLKDIRRDHVARYELVSNFLLKTYNNTSELFGGDIFCGNGYGSSLINEKTNCFSVGFDASSEAIELANNYYSSEKLFFTTKRFPFLLPENIFDFIISFETIEHVIEDNELLEQFGRSLKSGGYLFLSAPNEEICSFEKNNYEFHVKHYTFDDISSLLVNSNKYELVTWYGNGAYNFENGVLINSREDSEMNLKEKKIDSHLTYIFKKLHFNN